MSKQFIEVQTPQTSQQRLGDATVYSARVQEVMRYNKLRSAEYPLVMTLLDAVLQGYTEERWKEAQQQKLKVLSDQSPDARTTHADAANRYEQTVSCLKDLMLWPW